MNNKSNKELWLEKYPFGYYNSETDKGTGAEAIRSCKPVFEDWDDDADFDPNIDWDAYERELDIPDDSDEYDDVHMANLYGGDLIYCRDCGARLSYMDGGYSYCPVCNPLEEGIEEESPWKMIAIKTVKDADGFITEYAWYTDGETHRFIFGDTDLYDVNDTADWETDSYDEAEEWFNSYDGFEDEDEDDYLSDSDIFEAYDDDYEDDKPYKKSEILDELRRETKEWTIEGDEIYYGFESEWEYATTILKKHYNTVEATATNRYTIKFSDPKKGGKSNKHSHIIAEGACDYVTTHSGCTVYTCDGKFICTKNGKSLSDTTLDGIKSKIDGEDKAHRDHYNNLAEEWVTFKFTSGSNPYIAKDEKEVKRLLKKYGNKVTKNSDTSYTIDDKVSGNDFAPGDDESINESKEDDHRGTMELPSHLLDANSKEIEDKIIKYGTEFFEGDGFITGVNADTSYGTIEIYFNADVPNGDIDDFIYWAGDKLYSETMNENDDAVWNRDNLEESLLKKKTEIIKIDDSEVNSKKFLSAVTDILGPDETYGGNITQIKDFSLVLKVSCFDDGVVAHIGCKFDALVDGDFDRDNDHAEWIWFDLSHKDNMFYRAWYEEEDGEYVATSDIGEMWRTDISSEIVNAFLNLDGENILHITECIEDALYSYVPQPDGKSTNESIKSPDAVNNALKKFRSEGNDYGCDKCGKRVNQDDAHWFYGASVGLCDDCYNRLSDNDREKLDTTGNLTESKKLNEGTGNFYYENRCVVVTDEDYDDGNVPPTEDKPINDSRSFPQYPLSDYNDDLKFHSIVLTPGYYSGACIDFVEIENDGIYDDYKYVCENECDQIWYDEESDDWVKNGAWGKEDEHLTIEQAIQFIKDCLSDFPSVTTDDIRKALEEEKADGYYRISVFLQDSAIIDKIKESYSSEADKCNEIIDQIKRQYGYKEYATTAVFSNGETIYSEIDESLLQDLTRDKRSVKTQYGDEVYSAFEEYLSLGNDLGTTLYSRDGWNKFVKWANEKGIDVVTTTDNTSGDLFESKTIDNELYRKAMVAYRKDDTDFFHSLTDDELVKLQVSCHITGTNPYGAAYDDEVYDAIADRPNSKELFDRATEITINSMNDYSLGRLYKRYYDVLPECSREETVAAVLKALRTF